MTLDRFTGIQRARRNRPLLIVDIAVPHDFDPLIGELEQVMLYDIGDLRVEVERNLSDRRERLEKARSLVEHEAAACFAALRYRRDAGLLVPPTRRPNRGRGPPRAPSPDRRPARLDRHPAGGNCPGGLAGTGQVNGFRGRPPIDLARKRSDVLASCSSPRTVRRWSGGRTGWRTGREGRPTRPRPPFGLPREFGLRTGPRPEASGPSNAVWLTGLRGRRGCDSTGSRNAGRRPRCRVRRRCARRPAEPGASPGASGAA